MIEQKPMSQFRREEQTLPLKGANQNRAAKKIYEAFDKKGRLSSYLEIRCVLKPSQAPQSRHLMDVVYSMDFDNGFTLLYSFMAVEVRGANLKDVRCAIQHGQCEFIQEFHENEFAHPQQEEPMITSINFITGDKMSDILSTYENGK
jgi:hypothetical protein